MSTILDAETVLAVDVGSVNTRASLFDVVDGRYRLIATGRAPSTVSAPLYDVSEGVRLAMDQIKITTGRQLVDESELLIMPVTSQGSGVDLFVATGSAGPKVRTVLVGLMPGVSTASALRMAESTYLDLAEVVNLLDRRRDEDKISAIVRSRPDLILIVGGTDGGAQTSVMQLVDLVTMATELMPRSQRPRIIFAGNQELAPLLGQRLGDQYDIAVAPNARPRLHQENLTQARLAIGEAIAEVRSKRATGFDELDQWSGGSLGLTADAYGRVFRYLSRIYDPEKGVLGIDVGATHTMIAAAFEGDLRLSVESELGLGSTVHNILRRSDLERVMRWLPFEISVGRMRDYIFNKAMNPTTVPTVPDDLALEMALTREIIRVALLKARENWPRGKNLTSTWVMPPVEPIIASGGSLSRAPSAGMAALAMLDGVQPTGVTTLVLDPHNLSPSLGAAAGSVPLLSVHVLESGSYVSLGTVVSPVGQARAGRRILTLRLEPEDSNEDIAGEIRMGQLVVLPLGQGAYGRLTLRPERGIDVGFGGPGKAGALRVAGGAVGLIIDARGRPLALPQDPAMRLELNDQWLRDIGARE
ncbi:MAG: glutamate mutase L [Anaerolineales bacterium]|jgi:hypothetical protein